MNVKEALETQLALPELQPHELTEDQRLARFQGAPYVFVGQLENHMIGRVGVAASYDESVAIPALKGKARDMLAQDPSIRTVSAFRTRDWKILFVITR